MKKQVVVLTNDEAEPTIELVESLTNAGISVRIEELNAAPDERGLICGREGRSQFDPQAILYELNPQVSVAKLRSALEFSAGKWPSVPVVACRSSADKAWLQVAPRLQNT